MATIAQRVRGLGCWEAEVFPWNGRQLRCAGRQADALVWTGSSEIWTWEPSTSWMHAVLRSSLTGCPSGMVHSWLWTPPWCHRCMATVQLDGTQQPRAVWLCRQRAGQRRPRTLNSLGRGGGPVWSSWQPKSEDVGPRRPLISWVVVWSPGGFGAVGARTRQSENSKRAHFRAPALQNNTKIPRTDTQIDTKRAKRWREREEKARNFGPPTLRGPTLSVPHPSGPHPFGTPPLRGPTLRGPTLRGPTLLVPTLLVPTFSRFGPPIHWGSTHKGGAPMGETLKH